MKLTAKLIRWAINIVMVCCFLYGLSTFGVRFLVTDVMKSPTSAADLMQINVTVKGLHDNPTGNVSFVEYPKADISLGDTADDGQPLDFHPGDKIGISINKNSLSDLDSTFPVMAYGITDAAGKVLVSPEASFEFYKRIRINSLIHGSLFVGVPIIYFFTIFFLRRRKKSSSSKISQG